MYLQNDVYTYMYTNIRLMIYTVCNSASEWWTDYSHMYVHILFKQKSGRS